MPRGTTWRRFLAATALVHVGLTLLVVRDARRRDRPVGRWAAATLLSGLLGAVAYARSRPE